MKPPRKDRRRFVPRLEVLESRALPSGSSWSAVSSPNPSTHGDTLTGVTAISGTDAWAVGYTDEVSGAQSKTITEHWNGTKWSVVSSPNPGIDASLNAGNRLTAVAAVASNDVWAVGYYWKQSLNKTLIEHWDGKSWSVITSPNPGGGNNQLNGVAVISANDVWAVGYYDAGEGPSQTLLEHWDGKSWKAVTSPNPSTNANVLNAVTAISSTNVWAVGDYLDTSTGIWKTLTEHWDGTAWSVVSSPSPGSYLSNVLTGISGKSANDVWAVGYYQDSAGATETLIEHWDGSTWSVVTSPDVSTAYGSANVLNAVTVVSSTDIWAVGYYQNDGTGHQHQSLTLHWDGTSWSVVSSPTSGTAANLNAVTAASDGTVWAVGAFSANGNDIYTGDLIVPQTFILKH